MHHIERTISTKFSNVSTEIPSGDAVGLCIGLNPMWQWEQALGNQNLCMSRISQHLLQTQNNSRSLPKAAPLGKYRGSRWHPAGTSPVFLGALKRKEEN